MGYPSVTLLSQMVDGFGLDNATYPSHSDNGKIQVLPGHEFLRLQQIAPEYQYAYDSCIEVLNPPLNGTLAFLQGVQDSGMSKCVQYSFTKLTDCGPSTHRLPSFYRIAFVQL